MQYIASPSRIVGRLRAPASKSVAQRAIAVASLAKGRSLIEYPGRCDDVLAAIRVCRSFGTVIEEQGDALVIDGGIRVPSTPLNCGESGLGIRMFSGLAATLTKEVVLTGTGSLTGRPMTMIEASLRAVGVSCETSGGYLPITIRGPLKGGKAVIDGSQSSQALTGLLIASPTAREDVILQVDDLKSREYIDITIQIMQEFGIEVINDQYRVFSVKAGQRYRPSNFRVEGDWSGAAFLLVAGAVAGSVIVDNLKRDSAQPDRNILEALKLAGAIINQTEEAVEVISQPLKGFSFDATHCPDLFPPLAALAANCSGESRILGVGRLRNKESDRAATLIDIFRNMGISITIDGETMVIQGGKINGAHIHSHGDHRIAMAGVVAALNAGGTITIDHAEAVNKSYPEFYTDIASITPVTHNSSHS